MTPRKQTLRLVANSNGNIASGAFLSVNLSLLSLDQVAGRFDEPTRGAYLTLGGEPRLIARAGQNPLFSPDGKWIAFWVGQKVKTPGSQPVAGRLYVVSPQGGPTKQLQPEFVSAANPVWSPDGGYRYCQLGRFVGVLTVHSNPYSKL
jgi:hypothetical protein